MNSKVLDLFIDLLTVSKDMHLVGMVGYTLKELNEPTSYEYLKSAVDLAKEGTAFEQVDLHLEYNLHIISISNNLTPEALKELYIIKHTFSFIRAGEFEEIALFSSSFLTDLEKSALWDFYNYYILNNQP
ncbi:MAG: hypothetical protein RR645_04110 [Clostridium sp.]